MGKRGQSPRKFTAEFKAAAVRRADEEMQRGRTQLDVATALGIESALLSRWRRKLVEEPLVLPPVEESLEEEVRRLRRENEVLRQERDFAKKTAAYFARELP
jgi:transposase